MKYLDEYRDNGRVQMLVRAIKKITTRPWQIMEVCGGQTHSLARYRLEELLPPEITLLHGPGCPVCVTPVATIDAALAMARRPEVIMASFGDMMRVPGSREDLLTVKAGGADVRMLYSTLDAVELAARHPDREVVFFAVGFETTAPVHLMALKMAQRRGLKNFSLLTALFTVPPAIKAILAEPDNRVSGFLAAGHVCTVTGYAEYHALAKEYRRPIVVTGFEPADLLYGIYHCVRQLEHGEARVENAYQRAVTEQGNTLARALMDETLELSDQSWRGIGKIPRSGLCLRLAYAAYDAMKKFNLSQATPAQDPSAGRCIAGEIMKGNKQVKDCPHFGKDCTPEQPIGAPMVSDEGVCSAYYKYR